MKKVVTLFLALMLLLTATACTANTQPAAASSSNQAAQQPAQQPAQAEEKKDTTAQELQIEDQIVIGDWGGVWNEMAQTEVYAPFQKLYPKTEVLSDFPGSSGAILAKLEAQKVAPQMDVALMTELMTVKAIRADLLEQIDESKVPELTDVVDIARMENYGPAVLLGEVGIAYNPNLIDVAPTSWADLARPEYKGKVALPSIANTSAILFLCQVASNNGGSESDIQPAFDFLSGMKDNIVTTYGGDADIQQMFEREEVAIAVWWNGPALSAKQNGMTIEYVRPSDGAPAVRSFINVVKNCPHPNAAYRMVAQYVSVQAQQGVVDKVNYGPTNKNVAVPPEKTAFIATGADLAKLTSFDWGIIADNSDAWTETWNKLLG